MSLPSTPSTPYSGDQILDVTSTLSSLEQKSGAKAAAHTFTDQEVLDLGNLTYFDYQDDFEPGFFKNDKKFEERLKQNATKKTQVLFNEIFKLPVKNQEGAICAELPAPSTRLPRMRVVLDAQPKTRWQQFAEAKGIKKKKKRSRLVFDENNELRPRFGFHGINSLENEWVVEHHGKDTTDPFTKEAQLKKEKKKKELKNRIGNIKRAEKERVSKLPPTIALKDNSRKNRKQNKNDLQSALAVAQRSTISLGKFDEKHSDEKVFKVKKTKVESNPFESEKDRNAKVLRKVLTKTATVNLDKATQATIGTKQQERKHEKIRKYQSSISQGLVKNTKKKKKN